MKPSVPGMLRGREDCLDDVMGEILSHICRVPRADELMPEASAGSPKARNIKHSTPNSHRYLYTADT